MERPLSGRDVFLEWQDLLKRFEASELSLDAFCRQEDVGRSTFRDWLQAPKKEPLRQAAVEGETRSALSGKIGVRASHGEGEYDRDLVAWRRARADVGRH